MGKLPDLDTESRALGRALALHEGLPEARRALLAASNEHALLDITGIIAWHSLISRVVDMSGFYSTKVLAVIGTLAKLAIFFRMLRTFLLFPLRMLLVSKSEAKSKQL